MFFFSGLCGLIYQVVWVRLAFAAFGVVTPVLSVVVSTFMLGIATGALVGGRVVGPLTARGWWSPLRLYAAVELGIGASAFVVPAAFSFGRALLLGVETTSSVAYLSLSALVLVAAMLPFCVLMGATFPLMMAFVRARAPGDERGFSALYVANVLGAMVGSLLGPFVLIELAGFKGALLFAAALNALVGALALSLDARTPAAADVSALPKDAAPTAPAPPRTTRAPRVVLFLTGLTSMAMEIVWVRAFVRVLGHEVYSFALLLFTYLAATAIGAAWYRRDVARGRARDTGPLLVLLGVAALLPVLLNDVRWAPLSIGAPLALASIAPFSALLGYLTPRLVDEDARGAPARAGSGYALNVVGCIVGPLVASYLLLPYVSASAAMALLALPYVAVMLVEERRRAWAFVGAAVTLAAATFATLFHVSHEDPFSASPREVRRDHTATVISIGEGAQRVLFVNGTPMTMLQAAVQHMAHLPLLAHRGNAQSALTICFGMGSTWRSLLSWDIHATAVELVPSVVDSFGYFHADAAAVRADPKGRIVIDDGRRFLLRTRETFDIVTIDPPPPIEAAGSGMLYADEMYALLKTRLRKGAIVQQWVPGGDRTTTAAVARSIREAFPHVKAMGSVHGWGLHILASMEPFELPTPEELAAKLPPRALADLRTLSPSGDPLAELAAVFASQEPIENYLVENEAIRIADDQPMNEYYWLRRTLSLGYERE